MLFKVASSGGASLQLAQQHHERAAHLTDPTVFGRKAPKLTQQHVTESLLHALLVSNSERSPGFSSPTWSDRDHFCSMGQQQAAAWVQLLRIMAAADKAVSRACRL